ncbi:MAG: methyltransferase domain-containing protein [Chlamydiales bacterium]|nr:methyltransferase domain-containing protein [Chlamydiales bacterium]
MIRQLFRKLRTYRRKRFRSRAHDLIKMVENAHLEIAQLRRESDRRFTDLLTLLSQNKFFPKLEEVVLETEHPVAIHSLDHIHPRGTKNDNTRSRRFLRRCELHFDRPLRFLDLGCSGGGLVLDFILAGHQAVGLEGSDYSLINQRAEWPLLKNNLFTCDVTHPFQLKDKVSQQSLKFDVISCWEVLEHIPKNQLPQLFKNIREHLTDDGIFCASVATHHDTDEATGINWHETIENKAWWHEFAKKNGFELADDVFVNKDFPRGSGNELYDSDYSQNQQNGFHLVVRKSR